MTKKELIDALSAYSDDAEIVFINHSKWNPLNTSIESIDGNIIEEIYEAFYMKGFIFPYYRDNWEKEWEEKNSFKICVDICNKTMPNISNCMFNVEDDDDGYQEVIPYNIKSYIGENKDIYINKKWKK